MNNISALLSERKLPSLTAGCANTDDWRKRRQELLTMLREQEYGFSPAAPESVTGTVEKSEAAFAGKATVEDISLSFDTPNGKYAFPFRLILPKSAGKVPVFVFFNFRADVPDTYLPAEEIVDHGFAVARIYYNDVSTDGPVWDGIAEMYPRDEKTGWGKIGMWAFAGSRVLDYLESRPEIDAARAAVVGHSRLGKTALWCGAQDERFSMVISNDSGCSGAAISRGKVGESIEVISRVFPYWFCGNYRAWKEREYEAPFDQHMLLALTAPRKLYVASALEDTWADPDSEYLSCCAAQEAWTLQRVSGFIAEDRLPHEGDVFASGNVCYHLRKGTHFLSRTDWKHFMNCRERYNV